MNTSNMSVDFDEIWSDFDNQISLKNDLVDENENRENENTQNSICSNCESYNIKHINEDIICGDCGLVLNENRLSSASPFETIPQVNVQPKLFNSKLSKMQEWYMWSNEEKNTYKLKEYVRVLCDKLKIFDGIVPCIIDTVITVLDIIRKNDGTKRARVKDGIIVNCIYYVSKDTMTPYSYVEMAKVLGLETKYITKAEKMILELLSSKKLSLDKVSVLGTEKPFFCITNTIKKHGIKISDEVLEKVKVLIEICEDNDLLLDHTPLSVGVCCFYYVLKYKSIDIDIKLFSDLYGLSVVTVIKTFNKLKVYEDKINKMLW
jgi:transcription initiation factor TFIIIB Brf1 subunit/transcription initiation factor TFIIB